MAGKREVSGGTSVDKIIAAQTGLKQSKYPDLPVNQTFVNVSEAADMAGVTRQTVHLSIPKLPTAQTISGFLHFERADVERWIEARTTDAEARAAARKSKINKAGGAARA